MSLSPSHHPRALGHKFLQTGGVILAIALASGTTTSVLAAGASAPRSSSSAHSASVLVTSGGYRHGVVPPLAPQHTSPHALAHAAGVPQLSYGGGNGGIGVTIGAPRVYLVFYGSQWGNQGTNAQGNITLSGDPKGLAPYEEAFFKGLGTNGESWDGVMTQYCEGVATGATSCPASAPHVGFPTGGAFAGVWVDESVASPNVATADQLGQEAANAASHFGNTTSASNRNTQYVVISPPGTHPDNWNLQGTNYCAWHGGLSSSDGLLAFTNMPYLPDMGPSCGQNFVNIGSAGLLDGVSIVGGHEYAETITDQLPNGGWLDVNSNENGDKCAWISSGQGRSQDISLATGSFAVQSTWANDFNGGSGGCEVSHPTVGNGANTVTVTNPGNQASTVGAPVSLQIHATDSASGQTLTYAATGLPSGLGLNTSTGLISGTPTTPVSSASVTVTATDQTNASGSASFAWTVNAPVANTVTVTNPGNQTGTVGTPVSLQIHATDSASGQTLTYSANGLPAGLNINASTGLISGTPLFAVSSTPVSVSVTDLTNASGSASFSWTVNMVPANTVTVTNPGNQASTVGTPVSLQLHATDSASGQTLTYSANGLPAGLNINASSGLISGTLTTAVSSASVTVTATDSTNASGSVSFSWTVNAVLPNTVTVTNPGNQASTVGAPVSLQLHATDSASGQTLTYSANGLPAGLNINASSGLISGNPTTAVSSASVTVTATDSTNASGSASFSWTVGAVTTCPSGQLLGNPGFETGRSAPWVTTNGVLQPSSRREPAHSGGYMAWLDGWGRPTVDTLAQTVSIAAGCTNDLFSFWLHIDSSERYRPNADSLVVQVLDSHGNVLGTLATYSNSNTNVGYIQRSFNVSAYAGQQITVKFTGTETDSGGGTTNFVVDDAALTQAASGAGKPGGPKGPGSSGHRAPSAHHPARPPHRSS